MNDITIILLHGFWCAVASLGFAVLFNTPKRALAYITICGFIAGLIKFTILSAFIGGGIVLSVLSGAVAIGFLSLLVGHWCHVNPTIISISGVISFVPGSYAFKSMMGFIQFIQNKDAQLLVKTAHNATMTFFIILAIAIGVALPMLLLKIESVKNVRFNMEKKKEN